MRRPLVAGNWKMNGSKKSIATLLSSLAATAESIVHKTEIIVIPPFPYLGEVQQLKSKAIGVGAQNLSEFEDGAYTGEVSAAMLQDFACQYVLVGHSERRTLYGESNAIVAKKFLQAHKHQLIPIVCIGETLAEREQEKTLQIIEEQLAAILNLADNLPCFEQTVIAYEPVWAIGTGLTATPEQAQAVHQAIRAQLAEVDKALADSMRIIYGGSVKANNAASLFAMDDIDGALVGGASLDEQQFSEIAKQCNNYC